MSAHPLLERDELIEQAYFFRVYRERLAENMPSQEILAGLHAEILSSTRLPMAIQFLASEIRHSGELSTGMSRLGHYFTAYQTFVIRRAEVEGSRFTFPTGLLILEREATYRANQPTQAGLFVYQFESITRNRLGYDEGLRAMASDPFYDPAWRTYLDLVRKQVGVIDFADLVYVRSEFYIKDQLRNDPAYVPALEPLFGEKEGKIARASRGRDPLHLFAALQRQLGYPEVPRPIQRDDSQTQLDTLQVKLREMEARIRLLESEVKGQVDLSQFGKPELLQDDDEPEA